jgi:hypothetical protein
MTGKDILDMKNGQSISKSDLYNLIVYSKDKYSENWGGEEYIINNTPQQGINWIGSVHKTLAVIMKSKEGKYNEDSHGKRYAFKARNGVVNINEKANQVIINQPKYKYPLMYFIEGNNKYTLIGRFAVDEIFKKDVSLIPFDENLFEYEQVTINNKSDESSVFELSPDEKYDKRFIEKSFSLEKDLKNVLLLNLNNLFPKYNIFGEEYPVEGKRIDVLLENKDDKHLLAIELKSGLAGREVFGQISSYLGMLMDEFPERIIKGVIIAGKIDNSLKKACKTNPNIKTMVYSITLKEV